MSWMKLRIAYTKCKVNNCSLNNSRFHGCLICVTFGPSDVTHDTKVLTVSRPVIRPNIFLWNKPNSNERSKLPQVNLQIRKLTGKYTIAWARIVGFARML